ncbi:MAG: dihydrolipoyl dehydrogenase [Nitrososphaerales archaeon]
MTVFRESKTTLNYDAVVIGAGPGGYVCAIRLAQLGKSVAMVEKEKIGGVCLNVGCIPSKALITASKLVKNAKNASKMGINAEVTIDLPKLQSWKQGVVDKLTGGVSLLCKANKIETIYGSASIVSPGNLIVSGKNGDLKLTCKDIVVATGSSPIELSNLKFDRKRIISSTEALSIDQPPKKMLIVGGGVIGLEIGMAYANLFGTELTIVELLDQLLPGVDIELVNLVTRNLEKLNAKIYLKSKVKFAISFDSKAKVTFETSNDIEHSEEVDYVLVSVGRRPNSNALGLEDLGVILDSKGFVRVDKQMRTNIANVYAIGDLVGGPLLAHKASKEGIVAAEVISGIHSSFDNLAMPSAIFTDPEISIVGMNSSETKSQGISTIEGRFPFAANGRALASLEPEGFTKIIADKNTGIVLGVEIVGSESSDLISEASLAIEMGATIEDIALTIHPHPTLPEAIMEAAENSLGRAIHIQNRNNTEPA